MEPEGYPFFILLWKGEDLALLGRKGGDWLFQKDNNGGENGAGTSGMYPDAR